MVSLLTRDGLRDPNRLERECATSTWPSDGDGVADREAALAGADRAVEAGKQVSNSHALQGRTGEIPARSPPNIRGDG